MARLGLFEKKGREERASVMTSKAWVHMIFTGHEKNHLNSGHCHIIGEPMRRLGVNLWNRGIRLRHPPKYEGHDCLKEMLDGGEWASNLPITWASAGASSDTGEKMICYYTI